MMIGASQSLTNQAKTDTLTLLELKSKNQAATVWFSETENNINIKIKETVLVVEDLYKNIILKKKFYKPEKLYIKASTKEKKSIIKNLYIINPSNYELD